MSFLMMGLAVSTFWPLYLPHFITPEVNPRRYDSALASASFSASFWLLMPSFSHQNAAHVSVAGMGPCASETYAGISTTGTTSNGSTHSSLRPYLARNSGLSLSC